MACRAVACPSPAPHRGLCWGAIPVEGNEELWKVFPAVFTVRLPLLSVEKHANGQTTAPWSASR